MANRPNCLQFNWAPKPPTITNAPPATWKPTSFLSEPRYQFHTKHQTQSDITTPTPSQYPNKFHQLSPKPTHSALNTASSQGTKHPPSQIPPFWTLPITSINRSLDAPRSRQYWTSPPRRTASSSLKQQDSSLVLPSRLPFVSITVQAGRVCTRNPVLLLLPAASPTQRHLWRDALKFEVDRYGAVGVAVKWLLSSFTHLNAAKKLRHPLERFLEPSKSLLR